MLIELDERMNNGKEFQGRGPATENGRHFSTCSGIEQVTGLAIEVDDDQT